MNTVMIFIVAFSCVGISQLLGHTQEAGIFGAILGCGAYLVHLIESK